MACLAACSSSQRSTDPLPEGVDGAAPPPSEMPAGTDAGDANTGSDAKVPPVKRVFVTHKDFTGDLQTVAGVASGIEAADTICQRSAAVAGIKGEFRAFVWADSKLQKMSEQSPFARIKDVSPWYLVDEKTLIFPSAPSLMGQPKHAITMFEDGTTFSSADHVSVWTGNPEWCEALDGTKKGSWSDARTRDASSSGEPASLAHWFENNEGTTGSCSNRAHLYCFEQ